VEDKVEPQRPEEEEVGEQPPHLALAEDEVRVEVDVEGRDDLGVGFFWGGGC